MPVFLFQIFTGIQVLVLIGGLFVAVGATVVLSDAETENGT